MQWVWQCGLQHGVTTAVWELEITADVAVRLSRGRWPDRWGILASSETINVFGMIHHNTPCSDDSYYSEIMTMVTAPKNRSGDGCLKFLCLLARTIASLLPMRADLPCANEGS